MYINTDTLQYPLSERDIRALYPNTSFPAIFTPPDSFVVVFPAPAPAYDSITQTVREIAPELTSKGHWEQQWEAVSKFVEYTDENDVLHTVAEQEAAAVAAALAEAKAKKNTEINLARYAANFDSFSWSGKQIATDQLSRSDIDGINGYVALNGALPAGWPGAWKAKDNSYVTIPDVATWKSFYAAMVAAGNANFAKAQGLKTALAAATTPEQVAAIQW